MVLNQIQIDRLRAGLAGVAPLPEAALQAFLQAWEPTFFPKKSLLLRPGQTAQWLYHIQSGVQRSYYLGQKEYTMAFTYAPFFSTIPDSFLLQRPSKFYLEAITDSEVLRLSYQQLQMLLQEFPALEKMLRQQHELMIVGLHDRQLELMALTMEERFRAFYERSVHLFGQIPHKYIASYLHMDPTNLSKLIRKYQEKGAS